MLVKDLGEFRLIERFRKRILLDSSVIAGSGDDCAVLKFDKKRYQLFTCDMIVENVDFTLKDNPYLIGRKAVAISISDIASCCGLPWYCLISMGMPKNTPVKFVDRIFKGMLDISREYNINIAGGDLSRSGRIVIDVSMLGLVEKKNLTLRSSARTGDCIFVTGELGGSILGKHLRFTPRIKEARFLAKNFKVNAMIDISDGLVQDLRHILKQSKVGAVIYEEFIPLSPKARNLSDALKSGEEFELLFTLPRKEAKRILNKKLVTFKFIGEIVDRKYGFKLINEAGKIKDINLKGNSLTGFTHF
ncbi:MAG: thiamine-monophosphate kinase [Candidatus Omnitrophica bacterium CG08_land_8_20_14_0_20_41_16]|uniref:Thiamine-monophosphate kinase n=1 Tax=Candidatus Sherwoodlollariibacterium unditelluris TaxID=1974757 RepID=A0A2G9YJ89_9BACT|nr:MAG: thiamine-monophosphate kinase [Candidatus Omnitrophica bacterium CG23_combo_of_CG06-09_8_20_14_all_41_10]PIS34397.1 MAG: thiamine-monophosphate kinase [Candidatus Omnitrophica bacterium CG08_land_8_20_14_0_20_41_16]